MLLPFPTYNNFAAVDFAAYHSLGFFPNICKLVGERVHQNASANGKGLN